MQAEMRLERLGMLAPRIARCAWRQHTPTGAGLLALATVLGCASASSPERDVTLDPAMRRALARAIAGDLRPLAPGEVRVRLAFAADADLDLYVSDPLQETVYFANTPSAAGGRLEADLRCDAPAPRVETIRFPHGPPGRYRVGVDFPEPCDEGVERAGFLVVVETGGSRREMTGSVRALEFRPIVLEFDASADAAQKPPSPLMPPVK
jgi:hypothetical protein